MVATASVLPLRGLCPRKPATNSKNEFSDDAPTLLYIPARNGMTIKLKVPTLLAVLAICTVTAYGKRKPLPSPSGISSRNCLGVTIRMPAHVSGKCFRLPVTI